MDEEGLDRLSHLPDSLLCHIMLNLPTKDVVKSNVLSKRWRDMWPLVPGLDLECIDFPNREAFVSFVDRFLGFDTKPCIKKFKLDAESRWEWEWDEVDSAHVTRWIDTLLKRKVQHLHFVEKFSEHVSKEVEIPLAFYMCETLVSVKLWDVILPNPESVSLPFVKVMHLELVQFANDSAFEMLISGCQILKRLTVMRSPCHNVKYLRSQSLLSFTHFAQDLPEAQVVIDAPPLQKLELYDHEANCFVVYNQVSLVEVDIDITFRRFDPNDLSKRNMIHNFLVGISQVKYMFVSSSTFKVIYNFSRCEQLPLFCNLSSLCANFRDYNVDMLPIFLESCPNLKSIRLEFGRTRGQEGVCILDVPRRFLPSLMYVEIVEPLVDDAQEMELVSYFPEKSVNLKKLTLCLNYSRNNEKYVILKKLLAIPRLSSLCQISVLCSS